MGMQYLKSFQYLVILIFFASCGGSLETSEIEDIQKEIKERKIFRVTDREINIYIQTLIDSIKSQIEVGVLPETDSMKLIYWVDSSTKLSDEKGQSVIEAYRQSSPSEQNMPENIQELSNKNILYTLPLENDSTHPSSLLAIEFIKKQIIREMTIKK